MVLQGETNWALIFAMLAVLGFACTAILGYLLTQISAPSERNRPQRTASKPGVQPMVGSSAIAVDKRLLDSLSALPLAILECDLTGRFIYANPAANKLLGRRDSELLGLRFHSATWGITTEEGKPIQQDMLPSARALRGQTVRGFQHRMVNAATREKMRVSVTATPIYDAQHQITGVITAMLQTETLLVPAIEPAEPIVAAIEPAPAGPSLSDRVFNVAPSALVVVAADGRIRQANPTALSLTGQIDSLDGADFADIFVAEADRSTLRSALTTAFAAPGADFEPLTATGADGTHWRWTLLPLPETDQDGGALLLAGEPAPPVETPETAPDPEPAAQALVDAPMPELAVTPDASADAPTDTDLITQTETALAEARAEFDRREEELMAARDRAMAEAEIAASELTAARRMESVGRLTGGVAHDFTAMLGVITSALDMMMRQADEPERVRRLGAAALAAGQRGERLTRNLTAFSRDEAQSARRVMDIALLLRGLEGRLKASAGPDIDLLVETPAGPAEAHIDPVAFDGAVQALVRNAIEAVNSTGSIAVRLEQLDDQLRLSVRDSGPGMDADTARHALEPFFTTRTGSAGLGLSQAYVFAHQSSGNLNIDSRPGEGAEVSIILPAVASQATVPVEQSAEPSLEPFGD